MCGFLATTDYALFGDAAWARARRALASRGPDESSETIVGRAAFAHQRLAIIGLGIEGQQPVISDPNHVLVFNGEIYNYRQLGRELGIPAFSDTQVMAEIGRRGWRRWIHKLRGMYAFVHMDLEARTITAARDPFGIKPLYVRHHENGELSFASTVAALLESKDAPEPDTTSLVGFLAQGVFPEASTPFAQIRKLLPGQVIEWTMTPAGWTSDQFPIGLDGWPTMEIESAVLDSVEAHLVADVEVAVLLSGGVDSTLLAVLASRRVPGLRTFSLTNPDNPEIDEARYARHNAQLLGSAHVEVPVSSQTLAQRAYAIVRSTGEPFGDPAFLPLAALSEEVSRHVKVALAGEGADEIFGGYRRYDLERLLESPVAGRATRLLARTMRTPSWISTPMSQLQRAAHAAALTSAASRHASLMGAEWPSVMVAFGVTADRAQAAYLDRWHQYESDPWALGQPINRAYDTREWLPNTYLEKSDRTSMLNGLELRTPYLDPVVATSVLGWHPTDSRKAPLREALARRLPGVQLPPAKKGLAVDTPALVRVQYADLIDRTVLDPSSVLTRMGFKEDPDTFLSRAKRSANLSFRLAMLGIWQETWT